MANRPQIKIEVSESQVLSLCLGMGFDLEGLAQKTGYNYPYLRKVVKEGQVTYTMAVNISNALKVPVPSLSWGGGKGGCKDGKTRTQASRSVRS